MDNFTWDQTLRKYRDKSGTIVPAARVRKWIDAMTAALGLLFIVRANRLKDNFTQENFQVWNNFTRVEVTALHYAMAMLAYGGRAEMDDDKWTTAETIIAVQIGYFDKFAMQVATGTVEMNGHFPVRTSLYALAGHATYVNVENKREQAAGMDEEMRTTTSGNPCQDCSEAQARGWVPIGTLPEIGDSVCLVRCRCFFSFRNSVTDAEE